MGFRPRISVLLAFAVMCVACGGGQEEEVRKAPVPPVKLLVIQEAVSSQVLRFPAVVGASELSELTFQVSGLLQELPVQEAQEVKAGAVLAKLDPRDLQSRLDDARAQYDSAEAENQRAIRLAEGNAISTSEAEQRKSARDSAKAQLDAAQKGLDDSVLKAPFSGVVAKIHVEKFQNVQALSPIVTLLGDRGREVTINLSADLVAKSEQAGETEVFVILDVASSVRIPAQFKGAVLEADTASQTYEVTFAFSPPEDLVILPGMNATVIVKADGTGADQVENVGAEVPLAAVQSEGDKNYVWVIDTETMKCSKRWITIQAGIGDTVTVIEGLVPGETIAGAGAAHLAEGMEVRAWTE